MFFVLQNKLIFKDVRVFLPLQCPNIVSSGPVFIKLAETKFCLKSQVLVSNLRLFLVSNLLAIHKIVETKFSLRFGLKLKTGI